MKKRLILPAIGLDFVIQQALITFFCPEIINVSNHSTRPNSDLKGMTWNDCCLAVICDDIGNGAGICLDNDCWASVAGFQVAFINDEQGGAENRMNNNELIEQIKNPQTPLRDKIPLILAALDSAEYAKVRGTLIYALANYPAELLFEKAISWLINGNNFEMAHEATDILDKIEKIGGPRADKAYAAFTTALDNPANETWRVGLLEEVLEMFE